MYPPVLGEGATNFEKNVRGCRLRYITYRSGGNPKEFALLKNAGTRRRLSPCLSLLDQLLSPCPRSLQRILHRQTWRPLLLPSCERPPQYPTQYNLSKTRPTYLPTPTYLTTMCPTRSSIRSHCLQSLGRISWRTSTGSTLPFLV